VPLPRAVTGTPAPRQCAQSPQLPPWTTDARRHRAHATTRSVPIVGVIVADRLADEQPRGRERSVSRFEQVRHRKLSVHAVSWADANMGEDHPAAVLSNRINRSRADDNTHLTEIRTEVSLAAAALRSAAPGQVGSAPPLGDLEEQLARRRDGFAVGRPRGHSRITHRRSRERGGATRRQARSEARLAGRTRRRAQVNAAELDEVAARSNTPFSSRFSSYEPSALRYSSSRAKPSLRSAMWPASTSASTTPLSVARLSAPHARFRWSAQLEGVCRLGRGRSDRRRRRASSSSPTARHRRPHGLPDSRHRGSAGARHHSMVHPHDCHVLNTHDRPTREPTATASTRRIRRSATRLVSPEFGELPRPLAMGTAGLRARPPCVRSGRRGVSCEATVSALLAAVTSGPPWRETGVSRVARGVARAASEDAWLVERDSQTATSRFTGHGTSSTLLLIEREVERKANPRSRLEEIRQVCRDRRTAAAFSPSLPGSDFGGCHGAEVAHRLQRRTQRGGGALRSGERQRRTRPAGGAVSQRTVGRRPCGPCCTKMPPSRHDRRRGQTVRAASTSELEPPVRLLGASALTRTRQRCPHRCPRRRSVPDGGIFVQQGPQARRPTVRCDTAPPRGECDADAHRCAGSTTSLGAPLQACATSAHGNRRSRSRATGKTRRGTAILHTWTNLLRRERGRLAFTSRSSRAGVLDVAIVPGERLVAVCDRVDSPRRPRSRSRPRPCPRRQRRSSRQPAAGPSTAASKGAGVARGAPGGHSDHVGVGVGGGRPVTHRQQRAESSPDS